MPKITSKIKEKNKGWVSFDRSLMRDSRIKSPQKILYLLFKSFAETCEDVYLSYSFIAEEIGYKYNGTADKKSPQYERAMKKFICENLEPLIKLGWIKKINNNGGSCDWEIYHHDCDENSNREQKSTHPVNKKVHGNREQKSTLSKKDPSSNKNKDILTDFFKKNDLKEIVKQTIIPYENQKWDDNQATATLEVVKESMINCFENRRKLIKNPNLTFKNWILKHKKTDFYKYINKSKELNDIYNSNLKEFTSGMDEKAKIVVINPFEFDTPQAFDREVEAKIKLGYEVKWVSDDMEKAKKKWGVKEAEKEKPEPKTGKNLKILLKKASLLKKA